MSDLLIHLHVTFSEYFMITFFVEYDEIRHQQGNT